MSVHIVTGAFGYPGKYIAARLLDAGVTVRTVTNSVNRRKMVSALSGAEVLYDTYWVRFNHDEFTHQTAVDNTIELFGAAKEAGGEI